MTESEKLFSYGTLQQENVQLSSFGRVLDGEKDSINGYVLEDIEIEDVEVISKSGKHIHKILLYTGSYDDIVEGTILELTKEELRIADAYEVSDYNRKKLTTTSGKNAWAYIGN